MQIITPVSVMPLSEDLVILVDDEDYERVMQYSWYIRQGHKTWYASTHIGKPRRTILLHRFILNAPEGIFVDHKDGNGLNCQKSNIRLCTPTQNKTNTHYFRSGRHSPYRGVVRSKKKWAAQIRKNGQQIYLGSYDTPEEAAKAYDTKALELFGDFAIINFPETASHLRGISA